ncbi:PAS domain S-box protein [uncultured Desulfobacter sp.]|uniref:PAS domain S-box protein n=1 Tax=uncultured Desulfobacter sp. TaxID=240139 RepID=UPI0029F59B66|nr:PAS domain S-box protein [uncultured Desulfobacter sp.]
MVSGIDLFFSLFNNLAIFIALVTIYGYLLRHVKTSVRLIRQFLFGISFGLFAIGCMYAKISVFEGVIVDQRNAIVVLSGVFGGPVPAVVSAFFAGSYRIYLGGGGAFAGVIGVSLAATAGIILNRFPGSFKSPRNALLSTLAATLIILPGFLFVKDLQTGWNLMKAMTLPYGLAIFSGILLVGLLLNREEEKISIETSFRASQERLDLALSVANEGLWDWNIKEGVIHFDSRYYTISGYEPNEFPAAFEEWEKRVHPDDLDQTKRVIQKYLDGELESYHAEFRFLHKNGEYMWILDKGKVVARSSNGDPIRFIGIHADITPKKLAEESLRFTQFSIDNAAIGIWYIDENAQILNVNKNGAGLLGYLPKELKNMFITDIDPSINKENWTGIWQSLIDNRVDNFKTAHKHKDGQLIPVEITSNLFEYENRQFAVSFSTDITQRIQMEEIMIQSEKMLSVGGLAAGMAHEINNPLSGIVQNANLLKTRLADKNLMPNIKAAQALETDMETISRFMEQRGIPRILDTIIDAGLRMAGIIENMLNFARKSDASFSKHDPVLLMNKILELASADYDLKKHYDFKSISIEKEYADNLPMVACESAKIQQVILNILNNGAHAMFESPKDIQPKFILRLSHESVENMLRIEIEDNGPGMDKDTSKRIFEPFFTTKPVGVGTGLGLSVSYFIITENHNGSIEISSEPGKGSNFIIRLPMERKI